MISRQFLKMLEKRGKAIVRDQILGQQPDSGVVPGASDHRGKEGLKRKERKAVVVHRDLQGTEAMQRRGDFVYWRGSGPCLIFIVSVCCKHLASNRGFMLP